MIFVKRRLGEDAPLVPMCYFSMVMVSSTFIADSSSSIDATVDASTSGDIFDSEPSGGSNDGDWY